MRHAVSHAADILPVSRPALIGREKEYVWDAMQREELSWHGAYVAKFEEAFARFCQVRHCAATCNGTAALHLALLAAGVGPGWTVFLPALTYVATANAVLYCGAEPVFCDVDEETWTLNPLAVEYQMGWYRGPKAILPVHLYGMPADLYGLSRVAHQHNAVLIEDAAQAHGALYHDHRVGSFGRAAVFSFYANKMLTMGEGGAVVTDDDAFDAQVRLLRGQGSPAGSYDHTVLGYNYRITNLQAAVGLGQVECADQHFLARRRVAAAYRNHLNDRYRTQVEPPHSVSAAWMTTVLVPRRRDAVRNRLFTYGIETRSVFTPLTKLPMYQGQETPSVTEDIASRGINLPTYGELQDEEIERIVNALDQAVGEVC